MNALKFLLDTNVAIALEDPPDKVTPTNAEFARMCQQYGVTLVVAEPNYQDIARDRDTNRRQVFESKLDKYPRLEMVHLPEQGTLEDRFGTANGPNDLRDIELLAITERGAASFLITEDTKLHHRAMRADVGDLVLDVRGALALLDQLFVPRRPGLPDVESVPAYSLNISDPFFDSLRDDYPEFDQWFREKCVSNSRECWVVNVDQQLAGIIVRKDETPTEADCKSNGSKILKLCTFKVSSGFQGEKLGELLVKQVLWWSHLNFYDVVYLTAYEKHGELIDLLLRYGFEQTEKIDSGEWLLERAMNRGSLDCDVPEDEIAIRNRCLYPSFLLSKNTRTFCVPIRAEYHERLFPEKSRRVNIDLFPRVLSDGTTNRTPGNTIRKVYLCRAQTRRLRPGDILAFYVSKDIQFKDYQCITTLGVVDSVTEVATLDEVMRATARRSVFSLREIEEQVEEKSAPLKVIDFLLVGHLENPIGLNDLMTVGVLQGPPQTIIECKNTARAKLLQGLRREMPIWE